MYNTICKVIVVITLFSIISAIALVDSGEYWTGTTGNDWSGSIWYGGGRAYYTVWHYSKPVVSKFSSAGTPEWNLELLMPITSPYVRDSYLNESIMYILIEDMDDGTHCYVVGVNVSSRSVVYVREISSGLTGFTFTPRSLHVVGNDIYVLLDGGNGIGYVMQLNNTLQYNEITINISSTHYIELVGDHSGLYILCDVDFNIAQNMYAITVIRMDLQLTQILAIHTMLAGYVGVGYMYFFGNSITVDDEFVYVLAGLNQTGPPTNDLYGYYALLKYNKTDLSPLAMNPYGVSGRLIGLDYPCGHRIYSNVSNGLLSFTGFLANSTNNFGSYDVMIATAYSSDLSMYWMRSWRGGLGGLEKGTGIINPDIIAVIGYSGSHKGQFFVETPYLEENIELTFDEVGVQLLKTTFSLTTPGINAQTFSRASGGYDIIVLSVSTNSLPAPIPEPWTMVTLVVVFIVLASIIAIARKYR